MTTEKQREQQERLETLRNDQLVREKAAEDRRASTYLTMALADSELPGRFGKVTQQNIVGATPGPIYPQLPEGAMGAIPWPEDRNPLGYAVDAMEPVDPTAHSPAVDCAAVTLSAATVSLAVGEPIVTAALQSKSPDVSSYDASAMGGSDMTETDPPAQSQSSARLLVQRPSDGEAGGSRTDAVARTSLRRI